MDCSKMSISIIEEGVSFAGLWERLIDKWNYQVDIVENQRGGKGETISK